MRAAVPALPYQIALKLITLAAPPVGIPPERDADIPHQLWDLDYLVAQIDSAGQWHELATYTSRRYAQEAVRCGRKPLQGEPWVAIDARLEQWSACDIDEAMRHLINGFQGAQISRATQRRPPEWRARVRRLQFAARCASLGQEGWLLWREAVRLEELVPERLQGTALRETRRRASRLFRDPHAMPPLVRDYQPRIILWEHLGAAPDPHAAVRALGDALAERG